MPQLARCRPRGRGGGGPHDLGCHRRRAHRVPPGQPGRHARVSLRPHRYPRPAPCDAARALPRTGRWSCHRCRGGHGPPLGLPAHPVSALPADGAVLGDARPDRLAQPPATGATLEAPRSPRPAHGPLPRRSPRTCDAGATSTPGKRSTTGSSTRSAPPDEPRRRSPRRHCCWARRSRRSPFP